VACDGDGGNIDPLPTRSAVASAVTGRAVASLDQSGRFTRLQGNASDEINAAQAVRLANAYAKQFLPLEHTYLEKHRGGAKIDLKNILHIRVQGGQCTPAGDHLDNRVADARPVYKFSVGGRLRPSSSLTNRG
jgi:hypothetical protein